MVRGTLSQTVLKNETQICETGFKNEQHWTKLNVQPSKHYKQHIINTLTVQVYEHCKIIPVTQMRYKIIDHLFTQMLSFFYIKTFNTKS